MTSTVHEGVRGNAGILATFDAVAYDGDVRAFKIGGDDKDDADLTFAEAASGETKDYTVTVTALQSTQAGSFWRMLWTDPGGEFATVYGPHGNAVPTADKPHFSMTLKAKGRPEIGTEASLKSTRAMFDYTFDVVGPIVLDDGV